MSRASLVLGFVGLVGCGADMLEGRDDVGTCADNSTTLTFEATPAVVLRDADVELTVRWEAWEHLSQPVATLRVGSGPVVEVELPLLSVAPILGNYGYEGALGNPFGGGAPAGTVEVLAEADGAGCAVFPTAATAFLLE